MVPLRSDQGSTCQIMTFAAYYYDDQFFLQQIKVAGLELDKIENYYYTEERRIAYNNTNPEIELDKTVTDAPPFVMYHLYSGISQSSVLGSLLFSIYVKDIPSVVDSQTLMFADDTKILRQIQSQMDFHQFQQDINNLFVLMSNFFRPLHSSCTLAAGCNKKTRENVAVISSNIAW